MLYISQKKKKKKKKWSKSFEKNHEIEFEMFTGKVFKTKP